MLDQRNADARLLRGTRSGGKDNALRLEVINLFYGYLVVAADDHLSTQLTHVLHQVVGERVVVVENEYHTRHLFSVAPGERVCCRLSGTAGPSAALGGCDFFDFFHNFGGWKALES